MLETELNTQQLAKSQPKTRKKSFKIIAKNRIKLRAPSRQFNNPIYDGLEINQQNLQHQPLGPWIVSNGVQSHQHSSPQQKIEKSYPLNIRRNVSQYDFRNNNMQRYTIIERTISRNQLPTIKQIKQKSKLILHDLKFESYGGKNSHFLQNQLQKKLKPKLHITNKDPQYLKKNFQNFHRSNKIGTVIYNYCSNYNAQQSILNYRRKSDVILNRVQKSQKQQLQKQKLMGLKTYWLAKRSSSNGRISQFFRKYN